MKILHISDIHMKSSDEAVFSDKIIDTINKYIDSGYDINPELILLTGDFTNSALMGEFDSAKKEIVRIKNSLNSINQCILVPGNHDYQWYEGKDELPKDKRSINYKFFLTSCISDNICNLQSQGISSDLQIELDNYLLQHSFVKCDDFNLLIIGMNSNILESAQRAGQGYFENQHRVCKKLIRHYKRISQGKELITIAAFHHHVLPVSSVERDTIDNPERFSLTLDARRTLNFFVDNDVSLVVHGHQHQPSIVYWEDEMTNNQKGVYVVSVGTMTRNRIDIGDISKNSFMIYDIEKDDIKVYCFQDSSSDRDSMELMKSPFILSRFSTCHNTKCNLIENSNPPQGLEFSNYNPEQDNSDLFYLFLNVVDCDQAREYIISYYEKYRNKYQYASICGIHNLYGRYDVLLKYRSSEGALFSQDIIDYLKKKNVMEKRATSYFMNVLYENRTFKEITKIPLLKNPEAYLNSTWNMATLTVYLRSKLNVDSFFTELNKSIKSFNLINNTKIEDIIRDYSIGEDHSVLFELFISCYQFPMLTRFTNLIENIIKEYGIDKSTHIIYYFDERQL